MIELSILNEIYDILKRADMRFAAIFDGDLVFQGGAVAVETAREIFKALKWPDNQAYPSIRSQLISDYDASLRKTVYEYRHIIKL